MRALRPTCPAPRLPRTRQPAALRSLFACAPPCLAHPQQTCIDAPKYILALELPGRLRACRGWSCCPWATLRGCCGCCAPTRWLETSILCGRTVARIVSPEGRPASLSPTQAGVALGRVVCCGVPMDGPSGEGCVSVSGGRREAPSSSRSVPGQQAADPECAVQPPLSANRVPSSWAFSRRRAPQRPWGPGKIKFNACL